MQKLLDFLAVAAFVYQEGKKTVAANPSALELGDHLFLKDLLLEILREATPFHTEASHTVCSIHGSEYLVSLYRLHPQGDWLAVLEKTVNYMDASAKISGVQEVKEEMKYILDSIHADILMADSAGKIQWISSSFEQFYGVANKDVVGKTVFEMEEQGVFRPSVTAKVLKSGQKVTMLQHNKENRQIVVTGIPICDADSKIAKVISFSRDITDFLNLKEQYSRLEEELKRYSAELDELRSKEMCFPEVIGNSRAIRESLKLVQKIAGVDANVLLTGETGVGKNLFARLIHSRSGRSGGPFIEINAGAIPETLLESELFGYASGAFTGASRSGKLGLIELSRGGTLFLDEISELPVNLQAKLLTVIQEKRFTRVGGTIPLQVDFRLITATNRSLKEMVRQKQFREDLFYRLNVVTIEIPPVRDRPEDLFLLCMGFLEHFNAKYGFKKTLSAAALDRLIKYAWPGNVRELENVLERLVLTAEGAVIDEQSLPEEFRHGNKEYYRDNHTLPEALMALERDILHDAYQKHRTTTGVARALGISQPTAARKLRKHGLGYSE